MIGFSWSVTAQDTSAEMLKWGCFYRTILSRREVVSFHLGFSMKHSRRQIQEKGNRAKTTAPRVCERDTWAPGPGVGGAAGSAQNLPPQGGFGVNPGEGTGPEKDPQMLAGEGEGRKKEGTGSGEARVWEG